MKGEQYITGIYLERKDMLTKGIVHYKKHKRDVYILPGEVFCPAVALDVKTLTMPLSEYQFLCDMV